MTLGEKLAKLRKEYNYTQEQLAEILSVSRQSISKWELDLAFPETEKLIEIGKLYECSMDYLLKDEIEEKQPDLSLSFSRKAKEFCKQIMTEENKQKAKRILKIIGIIFLAVLVIDIISLLIYVLLHFL